MIHIRGGHIVAQMKMNVSSWHGAAVLAATSESEKREGRKTRHPPLRKDTLV